MKTKQIVAMGLTLMLIAAGCGKNPSSQTPAPEPSVVEASVVSETDTSSSVLAEPSVLTAEAIDPNAPEGMAKSYLTGKYVDEALSRKRPIAVMFNNIKAACPQSGIENADVLYEAPVEGGITRLMGIFENYQDLDKIGSVRSARLYFVRFALGWDAIYCSVGHSKYAVDLLNSPGTDSMDGVDGTGASVYYRTEDRKAPHNCYASAEGIAKGIEKQGFSTEYDPYYHGYFQFVPEGDTASYDGVKANTVRTGYFHNDPYFTYNAEDQMYYRFQFDAKQIDDQTGNQLKFKNLILQYCDYEMFDDDKSLNININSGGKAQYISNGICTEMTWKRDKDTGITHYYLADGTEVKLNTGKTYVGIILNPNADRVEITE